MSLTPVEVVGDHGLDLASLLSSYYPEGSGLEGTFDNIFDNLIRNEGMGMGGPDSCLSHPDGSHCGCLGESASYNVVLELSLRLRRAAETLGQYAKHRAASNCPIHQRIAELDRYTT